MPTTTRCCGTYHDALGANAPISLEDVRDGVRRQSFFGVMMAIVSSMLVERTARGDAMFMVMLERHCQHVLDTDALRVLPSKTPVAEPLTPRAEDEAAHPAGHEPLWNESWYFDFADPGQGIGGWIRLGLIPNQNTTWITGLVCGPDIPTFALVDFHDTGAVELTLDATEPLRTYRVSMRGQGQAYDDPAALLRDEPGRPVEMTMELTWTTTGTPYQYRITPRYEIPCTVSGTVTVDGHEFAIGDVPGQRDHSWGVRDWWAMDWVWSALHLDDGSHVHGVDLRIPGAPPLGIGYLQQPGEPLRRTAGGHGARNIRRQRFTAGDHADVQSRRPHRDHRRPRARSRALDVARRPDQPLSAGLGDGDHRRRPHRCRLAGMEPQPADLTP